MFARALVVSALPICAGVAACLADDAKVARFAGPNDSTKAVVRSVAVNLPAMHFTHRLLDEDVARSWCEQFLNRLDPSKLYFMQADVEGFRARMKDLPRQTQQGDAKFAYDICRVYVERLAQATKWAEDWIAANHDFTADEEMPVNSEVTTYPADNEDARERMRKRVKYDLLTLKLSGVDEPTARKRLLNRYRNLLDRIRQTTDDDVMDAYLSSLTACYDPHSTYFSPNTYEDFNASAREQLEGIGAALQLADGEVVVTSVLPGGPADKDGRLKAAMRVQAVGEGADGPLKPVAGLSLREVVRLVRGKPGSIVRLQVVAENETNSRTLSLVRAKVQTAEARSTIVEHGQRANGRPYRFAVINVPSLYAGGFQSGSGQSKTVTGDVRKILQDLKAAPTDAKVDAVILDLRKNAGGTLTEAVLLPGLFMGKTSIVQTKDRDGKIQRYDSQEEKAAWSGPLVLLTSRQTGSGAELIAAAIQDAGRGLVVGDSTTSGNGTIQSLIDLGGLEKKTPAPQLGALKITTQQFYRVTGESTQQRGVQTDVILPSLLDHQKTGEANLEHALPFDKIDQLNRAKSGSISAEQRKQLQDASDQRQQKSKEFSAVKENIEKLEARQARKSATLHEDKAREEQRGVAADDRSGASGIFDSNYYNDEVLAVAGDYVRMLGSPEKAN